MSASHMRDMTQDEAEMFLRLKDASETQVEGFFKALSNADGGWVLKAVQKRFEAFKFPADKKVMIMVIYIGEGVIGKCAKYVDDIILRGAKANLESVDFKSFTYTIYPMGFPVF